MTELEKFTGSTYLTSAQAPWGGHGVFPNIYRDMRNPAKYGKSLRMTYVFTVGSYNDLIRPLGISFAHLANSDLLNQYFLDCAMAIIGWLMFGDAIQDEITANILLTTGFPKSLSISIIVFIAVIPITKVPLRCVLSDELNTWSSEK
jgi:solute carrier family 32 (vesicular inhibitory amino acid transporter)